MDGANVDRYRAVATSATREAQNADQFVERVEREAGVSVELIEGAEEARLVALAVFERVDLRCPASVLVDVGGGSTELSLLKRAGGGHGPPAIVVSHSLPVGTVRTIEACEPGLDASRPVDVVHQHQLLELVAAALDRPVAAIQALCERTVDVLVGTGGNIETLADLCPTADTVSSERFIAVARMDTLFHALCMLSANDRAARYGLRPDRADTILPAIAILLHLARSLNQDRIAAPGVGLKEGVLIDLARQYFRDCEGSRVPIE